MIGATWVDDVIRFWFDELPPNQWWRASIATDEAIRGRFGALHRSLVERPPEAAPLDAREHLAAVLVYDQFSRNLYRGSRSAFAADPLALVYAEDALGRGMDRLLVPAQRHFLYMPLMHAEDEAMQARSVGLFETLDDPDARRSAVTHRDTVQRFGRFPQRNAALDRPSTRDEEAFLARRRSRGDAAT